MKKLIIITIVIMAIMPQLKAQPWETAFYGQFSIDGKMAIEGPYKGKSNDIGTTFNGEFSIGFEKSKGMHGFRYSARAEFHPALDNYKKATWVSLEYMLKDFIPGLSGYVGPEMYTIYRENPFYDFTDPYNFHKHDNTKPLFGANAELQYMIPRSYVGFAMNINYFEGEDTFQRFGEKYRWDVMVSILFKI